MKTIKALGVVLAGALLSTNVVSAAPSPAVPIQPVLISAPIPQDSYGGLKFNLVINDKGFSPEEAAIYVGPGNQIMVPIRTAAEALGYELAWKPETQTVELTKGNQWLSLQIGQDKYSFAKMYVPLGVSPELTNGKTYVPLSYFEKVMKLETAASETGTITIRSSKDSVAPVPDTTKQGSVTGITKTDKGGVVDLNGYAHGVRLNVSDETEIVSADNKKLTIADLQLGMSIEVEHSPVMAMSMPPMTQANKILVKDSLSAQAVLGTAGEITEVTGEDDGTKRLVIKGMKLSEAAFEEIVLHTSESTVIIGTKDNQPVAASELKQGDKVYAFYGPMLTKSLPPIGTAVKLVVEN